LQRFEFSEPHMGTLFSITMYAPDEVSARGGAEEAFARVAELDRIMTDYDPSSELMRLCAHPAGEAVRVSEDLFDVMRESQRVAKETGGAFDITVGPYVRAWREARKSGKLPSGEELAAMKSRVGYEKLRLDERGRTVTMLAPGMKLDLGGIGKGWAADAALKVLRKRGITRALVAASGDIAIGDAPPDKVGWKVGIAAMDGMPDQVSRMVVLSNAGISTSGDTEQFVEINGMKYSHIVDPVTGLGLTNRVQVTIIGPNATVTDGLDTPLGVMGVKRGIEFVDARPELAAVFVEAEGTMKRMEISKRFKERFGGD
jgi:thiamine biosynthesis lipoprotein